MAENATIAIPNDVLKPIVEARIQSAIIAALGEEQSLITTAIASALQQKVDSKGTVSNYSSENRYTLLEIMMRKCVIKAAHEALEAIMESKRGEIKAAVEKQITAKKTALAKAFVDGLAESINSGFRLDVRLHGFEDK